MRVPAKARVIDKTRPMNKLETRFWNEWVLLRLASKELQWAKFEPFQFKLSGAGGPSVRYTPDFGVVEADGSIWMLEVKGSWKAHSGDRDSRTRIKLAASLFPMFWWSGVTWERNAGWVFEEFSK